MKVLPLINTVLLLLVLFMQWQGLQQREQRVAELDLQYEQLAMQLDQLQQEQSRQARQLKEGQGGSLEAKVEEAGDAVVTGWQMLMSTMARELEKASESMQESGGDDAAPAGN